MPTLLVSVPKISKDFLRRVHELAGVGTYVTDPIGRTIYASRELSHLLRAGPEPFVMDIEEFAERFGHLDDRDAALDEAARGFASGEDYRFESRFVRGDGEIVWFVATSHQELDEDGSLAIVGVVQDITLRKRAEDRLRESEERFRALSENAPVGVYVLDDGRFSYVNPSLERTVGAEPGELAGVDPIATLVHPDDRALAVQKVQARYEGKVATAHYEMRAVRKDGSIANLEVFGAIVEMGGRDTIIGDVLDVTERKRAEEALRESESRLRQAQKMEAIGLLAGGIAHDFNNLLTVILSGASLLSMTLDPEDRGYSALQEIELAAERAASLTKQLLAFSRKQEQHLRTLDLNTLVAHTAKLLARVIGEDIELAIVPSAEAVWVFVDAGQMDQVLMNLSVNARDAMPGGGKLDIEVGREEIDDSEAARLGLAPGGYAVIRVTDTGVGMDEETQQRIFEPFFTTKEIGEGTGLGLPTVFGIVQQSHGNVAVESRPGHGTTFRIRLPLAVPARVSERLPVAEDLRGTETVLLVEDDDQVRKLARTLLTRNGYHVLEAASGGDALLIGEQHTGPIDVVLTDLVMPLLRGDRLVARLARVRPGIHAVYMSGYPGKQEGHEEHAIPGVFVEKPFTPESLLRGIRESLAA